MQTLHSKPKDDKSVLKATETTIEII